MSEVLRIDWGDGVSALDRVTRGIVMMTDAALVRLKELGHDRRFVNLRSTDVGLPIWIELDGIPIFEVNVERETGPDGPVVKVVGDWLSRPKARGWRRLLFWRK